MKGEHDESCYSEQKTALRFIRSGIAVITFTTYESNGRECAGWVIQYDNGALEGLPQEEYILESITDENERERKGYKQ